MKTIRWVLVQKKQALILAAPLAGALILSMFSLRPIVREALIGIVLVWLQITILFGFMK